MSAKADQLDAFTRRHLIDSLSWYADRLVYHRDFLSGDTADDVTAAIENLRMAIASLRGASLRGGEA